MDQLKQFFAQAKKHQFWIMISLGVILGLVGWYFTNNNLHALYQSQANVIKGKYSDMDRVRSAVSTHPNDSSREEMDRIIRTQSEDVQKAWEEQYQRQADYMIWPDIGLPGLIEKLKGYYPVELKLEYPSEPAGITEGNRASFSRYFDEQMPKLAKTIGVEWVGSSSGPSGQGIGGSSDGRRPGARPDSDGSQSDDVVLWPKSSQDELLKSIRLWQDDKPDVYEMIYTQENIWILNGLLNIIAKTNIVPQTGRPAMANIQAAIKEIEFIRIGATAIGDSGSVLLTDAQPGGGMGDSDGTNVGGGGSLASGGGDEQDGPSRPDPANNRYVNTSFLPLTGEELRSKIKSESPEDAYSAVAKRVPVRMRLTLDMRRLPDFLANCGNEGLMLEVRQVRIGDLDTDSAGIGLGGGSRRRSGGGARDSGSMGGIGSSPNRPGAARSDRKNSNEMTVEVYGTVYLFYPVNIDRLGLSKVEEDFALQDSVEATGNVVPGDNTATPDTGEPATPEDSESDSSPDPSPDTPSEEERPDPVEETTDE